MFPNQDVNIDTIENKNIEHGKSFSFDFKVDDFVVKDGKVESINGIDGLKIWIEKVLRTEKFKFKIYDTKENDKYGISLLELVNSGYPLTFIEAEIQKEVTETLLKNNEIKTVYNFAFNRVKRVLHVTFNVNSIYGVIEQEVII